MQNTGGARCNSIFCSYRFRQSVEQQSVTNNRVRPTEMASAIARRASGSRTLFETFELGVEAVQAIQMFPDVSGIARETFGYKSEGHSDPGLCCNAPTVELFGC
jgi:hypothetical protein